MSTPYDRTYLAAHVNTYLERRRRSRKQRVPRTLAQWTETWKSGSGGDVLIKAV